MHSNLTRQQKAAQLRPWIQRAPTLAARRNESGARFSNPRESAYSTDNVRLALARS
jgi:hypothetical protein